MTITKALLVTLDGCTRLIDAPLSAEDLPGLVDQALCPEAK